MYFNLAAKTTRDFRCLVGSLAGPDPSIGLPRPHAPKYLPATARGPHAIAAGLPLASAACRVKPPTKARFRPNQPPRFPWIYGPMPPADLVVASPRGPWLIGGPGVYVGPTCQWVGGRWRERRSGPLRPHGRPTKSIRPAALLFLGGKGLPLDVSLSTVLPWKGPVGASRIIFSLQLFLRSEPCHMWYFGM